MAPPFKIETCYKNQTPISLDQSSILHMLLVILSGILDESYYLKSKIATKGPLHTN